MMFPVLLKPEPLTYLSDGKYKPKLKHINKYFTNLFTVPSTVKSPIVLSTHSEPYAMPVCGGGIPTGDIRSSAT